LLAWVLAAALVESLSDSLGSPVLALALAAVEGSLGSPTESGLVWPSVVGALAAWA
jgi:hypothetical protein